LIGGLCAKVGHEGRRDKRRKQLFGASSEDKQGSRRLRGRERESERAFGSAGEERGEKYRGEGVCFY